MTPTAGQIIKDAEMGVFVTLEKIHPRGSLQFRKQNNGAVTLHWRFSQGATSGRVQLGVYDSKAPPKSQKATVNGLSIAAARHLAEEKANEHYGKRDAGGWPAIEKAKQAAQFESEAAIASAAKHTLSNLLGLYCDHLQALGRKSYKDASSIFKLHVIEPWPNLAKIPANQLTADQVAEMMRRVQELGKFRTANKLRSYLQACYGVAKSAKSKPSIPKAFKEFNITSNPPAETSPDETHNRADKNPLTRLEMQKYWKEIENLEGIRGALLRFHLLTGAQRIEQLVNLFNKDIADNKVTLWDGKGRPGKGARPHQLPLIPLAAKALRLCAPQGIFALSTDGGETHIAATTLSRWAVEAGAAIPNFKAKRLRSGVETLLAFGKISQETRGRLQSHGISGVQARHYDGHEYMEEKEKALKLLLKLLNE
ncbi:integrase [Rhodoferax sp. WC2427]|uniref:integrase n=1 Tax=Rhodoferax sp. WC2427 TaxID=3234144 RepID=UPI0034653EA3